MKTTEPKFCLICGTLLIQRPREPHVKFAERKGCNRAHGTMAGKSLAVEMRELAPAPTAEWDQIRFPTADDPGDGGFIKLMRDVTHVHYEAGSSWAAT